MKTRNIIIAGLAIVSLTACNSSTKLEGVKGKAKRNALTVVSKYPGRILEHYVEEGAQVIKGDTLAMLEVPEVEAKMQQAQGAVDAARAQYDLALNGASSDQLAQISAKLDAVTEQYEFAEKSYNRVNAMHQDSLVSDQSHDEIYMKYQGAKAQYVGVKAKYDEVKKGVRNEKIKMALGTYERAQGALQEANVAYKERYIVAPQNMTIETIALKDGELALPGYGIFTGYQLNSTFFRFTVPESKINNYKIGETYTVDSPFTDTSYQGKLVSIKQLTHYADITSAFPDYELGEATYELKIVPEGTSANDLYANITVILP
ncbi:secretion protein, HlyD family [Formosa agariphila KMM 3901]|uniref:Secretion protein, HlyD family n=1 Tax=Formosa agariphila (strain DSM 15362 / KCTC 12365 / LMG 23005 / KMM 3901 / M-2Alg 35-1) TaxID=1347342 RepID=T2KKP5_FORAG|nr:biotin/lipoyl-binding protein [Formosa agariphila]CDF79457.1 secretion protein, HlyD family [Formosa agariphila KMM 3901]